MSDSLSPLPLFELSPVAATPKRRYVRTTYTDEHELLGDLLYLHNDGRGVEVDPCYSIGRFWRGLPQPQHKFDIAPQVEGVQRASSDHLPFAAASVQSVMFDPPFVIGVPVQTDNSIMSNRFSAYFNLDALKDHYTRSIAEFQRILVVGGLLVVKCQDTITCSKQFLTHVFVINEAERVGFYAKDLFVLVRDQAIIDPKWGAQQHARKTHCYFLVFRKT